jgi:hypothetical protein
MTFWAGCLICGRISGENLPVGEDELVVEVKIERFGVKLNPF